MQDNRLYIKIFDDVPEALKALNADIQNWEGEVSRLQADHMFARGELERLKKIRDILTEVKLP